jgi:NADPH-dependent 2,4-dienoyl-CoA reductase/sulfur reductase-like enzyme
MTDIWLIYAGATTEETLQSAAVNKEGFDVERFDAVVIGAGAAGMFCAAMAGQAGRRVLLLDNGKKPGRKILMSGGGAATLLICMSNPRPI